MSSLGKRFDRFEAEIVAWLARYSISAMRISLGIVFFWFGVLKFVPGASPAQDLATRTIDILSFGLVPPAVSLMLLAGWECLIGLGLISGRFLRAALILQLLQMLGTIMPLFFFPTETFLRIPFAPTLEGQYIIKNIVLISAALVIAATLRGGHFLPAPPQAPETRVSGGD